MPVLRAQDFDKMASRVVDQFLSGQAKLADAAAQEAMSSGLNPDQIQRLVQAANTMTFLRMMDQRKAEGAPDLMHEFDPIDASQVGQHMVDGAQGQMLPQEGAPPMGGGMPPMGEEHEVPDEMKAIRMNPAEGAPGHEDSPEVEQCEEECHAEKDPPGVITEKKKPSKKDKASKKDTKATGDDEEDDAPPMKAAHVMQARARKLAGILEDQRLQAEWSFEETFNQLARRFKVANGPSYDAFEKDAMVEHAGKFGHVVLNLLRAERKLSPLTPEAHEKTAALADRHISLETPELHLFERLVKIATEAERLERGIAYVRSRCAA